MARRPDGSFVQVGIVSIGVFDCNAAIPEIQTRVDRVSSWVSSWIAVIEGGAPPPPIVNPPLLRLPRLTFKAAVRYAFVGLASDFRNRFLKGLYKELGCRRIEREKVKCQVFWYHARRVYFGSLTVYYALPREGPIWNLRYRIHKVTANCWLNRRNPRSCPGDALLSLAH